MKKILTLFLVAILSTMTVFAQTSEKKWNLGFYGGKSAYNGDLGNGFFNFEQALYTFGAVSVSHYLSPRVNLGLYGSYGEHGYYVGPKETNNNFRAKKLFADIELQFKFVKRDIAIFKPYFFVGVGFRNMTKYTTTHTGNEGTDLVLPAGIGLDLRLSENVSIRYIGSFGYTFSDNRDNDIGGANDLQLDHSLGLTFNLGSSKDTDGDGVIDKRDLCPGTPTGAQVDEDGCIVDKDKDGIADNLDKCPDVPGIAKFFGCPDTDGDGIEDSKDECPTVAGLPAFNGCPDTDGDGIEDRKDDCPQIAGLVQYNGCPDTDGDGIVDSKDLCPNEAGPLVTQGCPDRDGDGIIDKEDKCPDVFGIKENKGCPEIEEATKQIFEKALVGIQFETGKDIIRKSSFPILDDVVTVMKTHPEYSLSIFGHTDNVGGDDMNMDLSNRRAQSVKNYLLEHGVSADRIVETKGFGETTPVASNETVDGRTKNRRVEFKVVF